MGSVRVAVHPEHLAEIESIDENTVVDQESEQHRIDDDLNGVQQQIRSFTTKRFKGDSIANIRWDSGESGETTGEGTVLSPFRLQITLSGYGRLKRKWIGYMLISGAVEAVFQGVLVASALHNTWAGVAVGAEEMGSEWLTWHGGAWLFSKTFAPVTLEGRLWCEPGEKPVWRKIVFVSRNPDELNRLPEAQQELRQVRLRVNLHRAETLLLDDLAEYLHKEHRHCKK